MLRRLYKFFSVLAASAVVTGHVAAQEVSDIDRFDLFNECAQIRLVIESLDDDAAAIGLTQARIRTLAESRLRAARLYDNSSLVARLYIRVSVLNYDNGRGGAFAYEVHYGKRLHDSMSDLTVITDTWKKTNLGTHGGDAGFILQGVSERLDEFILEYLRVNEAAC